MYNNKSIVDEFAIACLCLILTDVHFITTVLYFKMGPLCLSLKRCSLHGCPFAFNIKKIIM